MIGGRTRNPVPCAWIVKMRAPFFPESLSFPITTKLGVFVFCAFVYAYPLTARFENTLVKTLQNSVLLSFRYPFRTLLLLLILALEVGLFFWNTTMFFFGLVLGPMVLLSTVAGIARGIFKEHPCATPIP